MPARCDNDDSLKYSFSGKSNLKDLSIVIIDDDPSSILLLKKMLEVAGATVTSFQHAKPAISWTLANKPDLVITDIHMPEISGIELMKRLRSFFYTNPIIAISSNRPITHDLTSGKCSAFLSKPVSFFAIHQQISLLLRTTCLKDERLQSTHVIEEKNPAGDLNISIYANDPIIEPLIKPFLSGLPARLGKLQISIDEENYGELASSAHQLKGALLGYGFAAAGEVAATIEKQAKAGCRLQRIQSQVDLLATAFTGIAFNRVTEL